MRTLSITLSISCQNIYLFLSNNYVISKWFIKLKKIFSKGDNTHKKAYKIRSCISISENVQRVSEKMKNVAGRM